MYHRSIAFTARWAGCGGAGRARGVEHVLIAHSEIDQEDAWAAEPLRLFSPGDPADYEEDEDRELKLSAVGAIRQ